jgi:hypothetical protein
MTTGRSICIFLILIGLSISACATPANTPATNEAGGSTLAPTEEQAQPTATPNPTLGPTATVWPPVFDLYSLGDIRDLDSFVVTITEKNTVNGDTTTLTNTVGYVKDPSAAYNVNEYSGGADRSFWLDGWNYTETGYGDWYIEKKNSNDLFYKADIPAGNTEKLLEAQFAGEEDYQGIPAYHFALDPANCADCTENYQLEGEFYVAKEGNYVLYSHWKETSKSGDFSQVYEVTQEMSSINQLSEISIPADMQDMVTAAELPAELGLPLPADSALSSMIRYASCCGVDFYYYSTPQTSIDDFLDYYRNLEPTDGWSVSHVGHVTLHQDDCEISRECVIINKGSTQVILYYNGASIRAEFDWPHLYGPL